MNRLTLMILVVANWTADAVFAQQSRPPLIQWQQSVGGTGYDAMFSSVETADGGFAFGGISLSGISGNKTSPSYDTNAPDPSLLNVGDWWVLKLDSAGQFLWDWSFGSFDADWLSNLQALPDGGLIVGGTFLVGPARDTNFSSFGNRDIQIFRLDDSGNTVWNREIDEGDFDYLNDLLPTQQGGWLVVDNTSLWWLDVNGGLISNRWSEAPVNGFQQATRTTDGGYVLVGWYLRPFIFTNGVFIPGSYDIWLGRFDADGSNLWEKAYGGMGFEANADVVEMADGGFMIVGTSDSLPDENKSSPLFDDPIPDPLGFSRGDVWLVRIDSSGRKLWDSSLGTNGGDFPQKLRVTPDGGAIVTWLSFTTNLTSYEETNSRIDFTGKELWRRTSDVNQSLYTTLVMPDGGFLLGGWSLLGTTENKTHTNLGASDGWLVRVDANGHTQWDLYLGGSEVDAVSTLAHTKDGGFIVGLISASGTDGNKTTPAYGDSDFWAVKLGPERPPDTDNDGVSDELDDCPATPQGTTVNARGCSIEQMAPCAGSWENHGQYVRAIVQASAQFREAGLITASEQQSILQGAAKSDCGKPAQGNGRSF